MKDEGITWSGVAAFNDHLIRAFFGFGMGWVLWQMQSPEWPFFGLFGILCAIGGAIRLLKALRALFRMASRARKLGNFRKKGNAPKVNRKATEKDLKARGLMR